MALDYETTEPGADNLDGQEPDSPETPKWAAILDAPDYLKLTKTDLSTTAREYEKRILSVEKEFLKFRLGSPSGLADVAAILAYGPEFAERGAALADHDERAKKVLDIITAPDNPWFLFALIGTSFIGQLIRNHETQVRAVSKSLSKQSRAERREQRKLEKASQPKASFTIPLLKKTIKVPFRLHIQFGFLRAQTNDPTVLVNHVFASDDVRKALKKAYGVNINATNV